MMIYLVAIIAGTAGFLFGFDEGIIAGALSLLRDQFGIGPFMEGAVTSATPFGALLGSLVASRLAESRGRRGSLLIAGILFIAGALFTAAVTSAIMLGIARLVLGIAIGLAATVAPLYISENAPAANRGMLVSIYQLAITLGILGAYLAGYVFSSSWRIMFATGAVPGLVLAVGIFTLSDTPRWLVSKGRLEEARRAIARINAFAPAAPGIEDELAAIQRAAAGPGAQARWSDLLSVRVRPALIVGVGLFILQQLSGINAVIYFAPTVFQHTGFNAHSTQLLATIGIGVVNMLMTFVAMALIDRIGRRALLFIGFAGTAFSLALISVSAIAGLPWLNVVSVIGLLLYISAFAASVGPLPWVMMSEIFPLRVRAQGMCAASAANWLTNFLVVFSFPGLLNAFGLSSVFAIYALACVFGLLFAWRQVPDTSGVTLEAIEEHLKAEQPFRTLGRHGRPAVPAVSR